jgi:hypothetical protein
LGQTGVTGEHSGYCAANNDTCVEQVIRTVKVTAANAEDTGHRRWAFAGAVETAASTA